MHGNCVGDDKRPSLKDTKMMWGVVLLGMDGKLALVETSSG